MNKRLSPDPDLEALVADLNSTARETPGEKKEADSADWNDGEADGAPSAGRSAPRAARWPLPADSEEGRDYRDDLLQRARRRGATDLLLVAGSAPTVRCDGSLEPLGDQELNANLVGLLCGALVPPILRGAAQERGAVDFSNDLPGVGRCRCNVHRQRNSWSAAIRLLAEKRPTLESLNLPPELGRYAELEHGLVLVTGPTGSGKSSTLAALLHRLLGFRRVHLITVEDPVEYEHQHAGSVIEHIEVGRDVPSFSVALRAALRQDPDVLLVGEMRDAESIGMAITAAETGHLVFSTLHTADAPQSVHRIIDSYPGQQQEQIRSQLSVSLAGIISQQLLPRADGEGRLPAIENLVATAAVRNLVRQGKVQMLRSQLMLEQQAGMLSMDVSLARLVKEGKVTLEEARFRARSPEELEKLVYR